HEQVLPVVPAWPGQPQERYSIPTRRSSDLKNNSSSQTQLVKVHDTIAPVPVLASLATVTGQCVANLPVAPTATDNCDVGVITGVPDLTGPFSEGDYTITWTYTDSKNNSSSQTQLVKVHEMIRAEVWIAIM